MTKTQMPEPVAWTVTVGEDFKNCIEITHYKDDAEAQYKESIKGGYESLYLLRSLITTDQAEAYADARVRESQQWQPIETARKTGRTVLLGFVNSHGNWRTMMGRWISKEEILDEWEDGDLFDEGWYEISFEADDVPNCWLTSPSHWMPLPLPPTPPSTKEG